MHRLLGPLLVLLASGCARTVQVSLPAAPAVTLQDPHVAVVAADRGCREVANALVVQLNAIEGIEVDPEARVRLEVIGCERPLQPIVIDVQIQEDDTRRRITQEGRAHAVVLVKVDGETQAHLIGAARRSARSGWDGGDPNTLSRTVERELTDAVATDLAEQVRPVPRMVARRVYTRAPEGTAHALHNLAVEAERQGRLHDARRLARAAHDENPTPRSRAYLDELDRLASRWPVEPTTAP